ncbi:hypothetical protein [Chitinophaga sp. LS1]|uniref:hypothetical protein n=1 Tax=Chitinophaga sp. LS1 TaxID=3051176 RepID=UPI002AAB0DE5|nr:hypothetical protein [Chitinophaga sp. LS1]WPV70598.1 hypothetical protein QQL36_17960 [Chitinophaga sp. LS1]
MKKLLRPKASVLLLALSLIFASCSEVRLIGAYDERTDETIQTIAKELSTVFVEIDKKIDNGEDWSYKNFEKSYTEIESDLKVLAIRVSGLPKYKIIQQQVDLLTTSVKSLEKDHATGFGNKNASVEALKKAIAVDESGLQVSLSSMLKLQHGLKREK